MRKIAVFMNTNEVGGAERSLVHQLKNNNEGHFTFFIPLISKSRALETFLQKEGFLDVQYYHYEKSVYALSRKNLRIGLSAFKDIYNFFFEVSAFKKIHEYNMVYLNGNKAALLFLAKNRILKFQGKVVWHLRDYYHATKATSFVWSVLNNLAKDKLSFVCNSHSVKESLQKSLWSTYPVSVVYNPVGEALPVRDQTKALTTLGFVSMLAPWKGVHEIVLWCHLFEEDLKALGIEEVKIYGGDIYRTQGETQSYEQQLRKLSEKFPSSLVRFEGNKSPEVIYKEIDCLIHYSLAPEPFGRVIIEAFESGIPVISTCLGGSAELVDGQVNGLKVMPHDRKGLYLAVEQLVFNKVRAFKLVNGGFEKAKFIQKNIVHNMRKVLDMGEAS